MKQWASVASMCAKSAADSIEESVTAFSDYRGLRAQYVVEFMRGEESKDLQSVVVRLRRQAFAAAFSVAVYSESQVDYHKAVDRFRPLVLRYVEIMRRRGLVAYRANKAKQRSAGVVTQNKETEGGDADPLEQ